MRQTNHDSRNYMKVDNHFFQVSPHCFIFQCFVIRGERAVALLDRGGSRIVAFDDLACDSMREGEQIFADNLEMKVRENVANTKPGKGEHTDVHPHFYPTLQVSVNDFDRILESTEMLVNSHFE